MYHLCTRSDGSVTDKSRVYVLHYSFTNTSDCPQNNMAATTRIDLQRQGHSRVSYNDRSVNST